MNKFDKPIPCVIIDDEPYAREVLRGLIGSCCPSLQILGEADSISEGQQLIRRVNPSLVFLDVNMPSGTGFDLLKGLQVIPEGIIFTTADESYALKMIKAFAFDYLLKPISRHDLVQAVLQFQQTTWPISREIVDFINVQMAIKSDFTEWIAVRSTHLYQIIRVRDILYCEGDRSDTIFHISENRNIYSGKTLKEYESLLDPSLFIRVHSRYLINVMHVKFFAKGSSTVVMANGESLDVLPSKKQILVNALL